MRGAVLGLWLLAACGERQVDKLEQIKRAVCTCETVECADTAMKQLPSGDVHASHKEQGVARDMLDCYAKLVDAAKPAPPAE